jgi:hypothetical protein
MLKFLLFAAITLSTVGLMVGAPEQALAAAACGALPQQKTMAVAGTVIQVGKEPLTFQHMVVLDDKTNCRVVVLVENNDKPCAYQAHATITIPVAQATTADRNTFGKIDYMDKGQNEMFTCK